MNAFATPRIYTSLTDATMEHILTSHCERFLNESVLIEIGLGLEHFEALSRLYEKWKPVAR
jgi:hypothetical protein